MKKIHGIYEIAKNDKEYPKRLLELPDSPKYIYAIGNIDLLNSPRTIGSVGSRKCSEYGKIVAKKIGNTSAMYNTCLISGMANGIDSMSHIGALEKGGDTIAVLGCGVDYCYPSDNRKLYERIKEEGLVISEEIPGTTPKSYMFPKRNRIIAGLSDSVVVAEANTNSGALITAELANQYNKPVFAVPGNINSQYSLGSNKLIMDGATIVPMIDSIFFDMGYKQTKFSLEEENLGTNEKEIFMLIKENGEVTMDFLCQKLNKPQNYIMPIVSILEIKGLVSYDLGKIFVAKF